MKRAFTLIEIMIVVVIIAFLSILSIPSLMKFLAKAKRTEAYVNLGSLAMAQKAYFAQHNTYSTNLNGKDGLNWKPESSCNYSYGFSEGSEGESYFIGKFGTSAASLSKSYVKPGEFVICSAGDVDGDGEPDILCIDQNNEISIVQDDLA